MKLVVNGTERELGVEIDTVGQVLDFFGVPCFRAAVELNGDIVDPALFDKSPVHDGDTLEIVSFVGGG